VIAHNPRTFRLFGPDETESNWLGDLRQGWLEGYVLTGRHGLFDCYEAFTHIVDSMFNQHARWLESTQKIPWRRPVASPRGGEYLRE
jgi:xylulose-5-phosphate/fructose-6-phosphate phosphoketolase